jgi:DNA-binding protein H-NS
MARTLEDIQRQIAKLQEQAEALKARERSGIIERIKVAIAELGLTPDELFGAAPAPSKVSRRMGRPPKAAPKKRSSAPKYTDGAGKTWTGTGKRPGWYVEGLASGKSAEDMLIKA